MWIMTKNGFVSIVNHTDPELMRVRARRREAIENQFSIMNDEVIDFGPGASDYRYHADVQWTDVVDGLRDAVKNIDYSTNAKGNMSGGDEVYHTALLKCWGALHKLQSED